MNTAEQILVVFLSTALAVFLVLAIAVAILVIGLMRRLNHIADKAEELVNSAEATAESVKNMVGQISFLRFVHNIVDMVTKHKSKG